MHDRPRFNQVNIVASDIDAAARFYRVLGVEIDDAADEWPQGSGARHLGAQRDEAAHLDLDNAAMARIWGGDDLAVGSVVIGFSLGSPEAVDATHARLVAAGYRSCKEPYDAFFGARYAVVHDPDGHDVGLMSPIVPERRYVPKA